MINKNRSIPLTVKKEEALLRRLPLNHPQYPAISESLARRRAGYRGERAVDYFLKQLDCSSFHIFHDLRFRNKQLFFQMDTLLLTPHFLLIIEVKNIKGTLNFDTDFAQMTRSLSDKEEGFRNPLTQAMVQKDHLYDFLLTNGFASLPIEYVIAISYPSTIIKSNVPELAEVVIHAENLLSKVKKLMEKHAGKKASRSELQRLTQLFLKMDVPLITDVLQKYQIPSSTILTGVQCPNCNNIPMVRERRRWHCPSCGTSSSSAHEQAIQDYMLLISPTITNHACREFLHLPSRSTMMRYLVNMGLKKTGTRKSTTYEQV